MDSQADQCADFHHNKPVMNNPVYGQCFITEIM